MIYSEKLDFLLIEIVGMKTEFQGMKTEFQDMKTGIQNMKADIKSMQPNIKSLNIRMDDPGFQLKSTECTLRG